MEHDPFEVFLKSVYLIMALATVQTQLSVTIYIIDNVIVLSDLGGDQQCDILQIALAKRIMSICVSEARLYGMKPGHLSIMSS